MSRLSVVAGVILAIAISWAAHGNAQVAGGGSDSESDEAGTPAAGDTEAPAEVSEELLESRVMDEITVIAGPQGRTAFELEMERQARMRESIYAEIRLRERAQEEQAWRQADPDLRKPESRIKWGYSPQAEQRMRRQNDFMYDLPIDQTKPASVIRLEF